MIFAQTISFLALWTIGCSYLDERHCPTGADPRRPASTSLPVNESGTILGPGEMPEWPMGADCKSAGECLRRFESYSPHHLTGLCSSVVEHLFGKEEVTGPIPVKGSSTDG